MPDTAAKALSACNNLHYPNVHTLLQIICTLPVTTSVYEHSVSVSVIRRLKTCLRATMGMSGLALMHIHYDMQLNIGEITDRLAKICPRSRYGTEERNHDIILFISFFN